MNSLFNDKSFDEISYSDIRDLVQRRVPESLILDYKGDIFQLGQKPKAKEFGKDVSAFANTFGGWIIYGIATSEGDEIFPLEKDAIVGIENSSGLKEQIENLILSSISPKPLFRIKKIDVPNSNNKCLILIYIPQSYNYVHMVTVKGENRFYKRYEYSSVPMDYYEVKKKFEEIGQTEDYREVRINQLIELVSKQIPEVNKNNLFSLSSFPKLLIENHFNDKKLIDQLYDSNRQHSIIKFGTRPKRKANRFYGELIFEEDIRKASINYFYNGTVIQVMPIDLFENNIVNASALYYYIYNFIELLIKYYQLFSFQSVIDLRFDLRGVINRELVFISKSQRRFSMSIHNFIYDEELEPPILTLDVSDLEAQKVEIAKNLIQPLFYGLNFEAPIGLCDEQGTPLYYQ